MKHVNRAQKNTCQPHSEESLKSVPTHQWDVEIQKKKMTQTNHFDSSFGSEAETLRSLKLKKNQEHWTQHKLFGWDQCREDNGLCNTVTSSGDKSEWQQYVSSSKQYSVHRSATLLYNKTIIIILIITLIVPVVSGTRGGRKVGPPWGGLLGLKQRLVGFTGQRTAASSH